MDEVVSAQRAFYQTNATKDVKFRIEQLRKLKQLLKNNEALLGEAIYKDFKKSSFDNFVSELSIPFRDIDEAVKNIKRWSRPRGVFPWERLFIRLQQNI